MIFDRAYCKSLNIDFSPKRLYGWYSIRTGISNKDISKMREDLGDIKTTRFLEKRLRELKIQALRWT
jgi:hypothetical protein